MYYGLVGIAVVMFGFMFLTNKKYSEEIGSGLFQAMLLNVLGAVISLPMLLALNGFSFEYTHFSFIMGVIVFANGLLFTLCSLKSFSIVNLSVYSLLSMLGGMILPIIAGVMFFGEKMTVGIIICVAFIIVALLIGVKPEKYGDKRAILYYAGVFTFNGLSGVLSKVYVDSPFEKISSAGYSLLCGVISLVISAVYILVKWKKRPKITKVATVYGIATGPLSRIPNYLLLISLAVLPASVNYPLVTGGTIIVTTVLGYLTDKKPASKDWLAVVLSFFGIMALTLLT
ncbi:MAG: hypothetical protein J6D20_04285 [Clostridia bacterium]|nr:hypothetical protein [Clostridia bacterium]